MKQIAVRNKKFDAWLKTDIKNKRKNKKLLKLNKLKGEAKK